MSTPAAEDLVAAVLVAARREGRSLTRFPGVVPASMAEAYRIQELAMSLWQDSLVGWTIGYISADRRSVGDPGRLLEVPRLDWPSGALNILASRGQRLGAGMVFATGAITGIHPIPPGQHCRVEARGGPSVELRTADARTLVRS
jgi:2-keto-4-pentenoate hydratase